MRAQVRTELSEAITGPPHPSVLVWVNLQNFKAYNVLAGHQRLARMGRAWRVYGDEFAAVLAQRAEAGRRALHRLRRQLRAHQRAVCARRRDRSRLHVVPSKSGHLPRPGVR